jgi:uncharacterized protein DUF4238
MSVPRKHHFAPQVWLAGFTDTGQNDGRLWVTDLKKRKQWPSNPINAGHRRDFYRTRLSDPVAIEKAFSKIEDFVAPTLKSMFQNPRVPRGNDLDVLLYFAAFQYVRVPAFRSTVLKMADSLHRELLAKDLKSRETWRRALKRSGIPADSPSASYEDMLKFQREVMDKGDYSISAENDWYLLRGFTAAQHAVIPAFRERYWSASISSTGRFIGSDNPVMMDGPPGQVVGFKNADIILFPVNRHVLLHGTLARVRAPAANLKFIARQNTFTMLNTDEHVYSHEVDFSWLDQNGSYQDDWKLFSKEKIIAAIPTA